ncbi:DNA repair protein XRCC3-like protein, partial [Cucurbita argyrosperma subsp. argyrosperma]
MTPENLLHLLQTTQKCTFGCPIIDRSVGGGVACNSLTEIVSESGCGKTQLCLQLCHCAQLPLSLGGLNAASLYIHTEFPFPFRRLQQLSQAFSSSYPQISNPSDHIFVEPVHSAQQLFDIMPKIESFLANRDSPLPTRLIVIDSIAALFRSDFDNTPSDLKRRSALFFKISGKLKLLAKRYSLAVVLTNQVVDLMDSSDGINALRIGNLKSLCSSGRRVCPALGIAWANCVNSRLFLSRNEEVVGEGDGVVNSGELAQRRTRRWLHVVFAPHLPKSSCEYVINRQGVVGVESQ